MKMRSRPSHWIVIMTGAEPEDIFLIYVNSLNEHTLFYGLV